MTDIPILTWLAFTIPEPHGGSGRPIASDGDFTCVVYSHGKNLIIFGGVYPSFVSLHTPFSTDSK